MQHWWIYKNKNIVYSVYKYMEPISTVNQIRAPRDEPCRKNQN